MLNCALTIDLKTMPLTTTQTRTLRSLAHALKPVVIVGHNGLSENVLKEIDQALEYHELIKVRLNAGDREQRTHMIDNIVQASRCEHVQLIGHIGVFYRHNPKRNRITLPKK